MKLPPSNSLPPPCDLGGPIKFTSWRPEQIDAITRIVESDKRFICLNMPTGTGKSLVASMAGRLLDKRTLILNSTKALQDQILKDDLVDEDIRGQGNYVCTAVQPWGPLSEFGSDRYPVTMVDKGPCHAGVHCWMRFSGCEYFDKVRRSRESIGNISSNYSYWHALGKAIRDGRGDEQLGRFGLLVCDEAHSTVNELCTALRVEIPVISIESQLGLKPIKISSDLESWRIWASNALVVWGDEMDRISLAMKGQHIDRSLIDDLRGLQQLGASLDQVSRLSGDWVVGESWKSTQITFDPVWPTDYSEDLLFRGADKVVLLSATIVPKTLDILGIDKKDREYVEYPSSFPPKRHPVYILKSAPRVDFRMSAQNEELWIGLLDAFIGPRLLAGRKGIIHCVSYGRMERIRQLSKYRDFFICNTNSFETKDAIERYRNTEVAALLSPSVTTGEDFPDDDCRWIVVAKLPFTDSRDAIAKKREENDPGYGGFTMMVTLVQSTGRGGRHIGDWCESIILDSHATWAYNKYKHHAPNWWKSRVVWVETLPEMLEVA